MQIALKETINSIQCKVTDQPWHTITGNNSISPPTCAIYFNHPFFYPVAQFLFLFFSSRGVRSPKNLRQVLSRRITAATGNPTSLWSDFLCQTRTVWYCVSLSVFIYLCFPGIRYVVIKFFKVSEILFVSSRISICFDVIKFVHILSWACRWYFEGYGRKWRHCLFLINTYNNFLKSNCEIIKLKSREIKVNVLYLF